MGSCTVDRRTENLLAKNIGGCRNICFFHSDLHFTSEIWVFILRNAFHWIFILFWFSCFFKSGSSSLRMVTMLQQIFLPNPWTASTKTLNYNVWRKKILGKTMYTQRFYSKLMEETVQNRQNEHPEEDTQK